MTTDHSRKDEVAKASDAVSQSASLLSLNPSTSHQATSSAPATLPPISHSFRPLTFTLSHATSILPAVSTPTNDVPHPPSLIVPNAPSPTKNPCEAVVKFDDFVNVDNVALKHYLQQKVLDGLNTRSRWLESVLMGQKELHPTELCGASAKFELQLLRIPREIRDKIFKYILILHGNLRLDFRRSITGTSMRRTAEGRPQIAEIWEHWCSIRKATMPDCVHATALLATCKQSHEEGCIIFYGKNLFEGFARFHTSRPYDFDSNYKLMPSHMALIRDLRLLFGGLQGRYAQKGGGVEELACVMRDCFPSLRKLSLSSFCRYYSSMTFEGEVAKHANELLVIAATITQHHPTLKRAIWEAESGGAESGVGRTGLDPRHFVPTINNFYFDLYIDLVPIGSNTELLKTVKEKFGVNRKKFISKNIILDCQKIRETPWEQLFEIQVGDLALPESATSSQPLNVSVLLIRVPGSVHWGTLPPQELIILTKTKAPLSLQEYYHLNPAYFKMYRRTRPFASPSAACLIMETALADLKPNEAGPSIVPCNNSRIARYIPLEEYVEEQSHSSMSNSRQSHSPTSNSNGQVKPHPAELSGASQNPKLQLLGVAREVRDNIFRQVLVVPDDDAIVLTFHKYTPTITHANRRVRGRDSKTQQDPQHSCNIDTRFMQHGTPTINLLRACRQTYAEGSLIFYGMNKWYKTSIKDFETVSSSALQQECNLPARNIALIKDLNLKIDLISRRHILAEFDDLISFICDSFPSLQHLRLVFNSENHHTATTRPLLSKGCTKELRGLLDVVATSTHRHAILKKAIWNADSGGEHAVPTPYINVDPRLWPHQNCSYHLKYKFIVDLVPERHDDDLFKIERQKLDDDHNAVTSKNIILDCQKIRNVLFENFLGFKLQDFALPESATSSEPQTQDSRASKKDLSGIVWC
ncbi:hypothetical protein H2200_007221 [Cladophialophora chaetospira]|uniref:F-box domain-containing protein n=1 Tax=Cladophialophora chaetospira TaxID=386627 RepID=A0AA39CHG0_9EURO|nr:hypothetical protein H2200_007221 [Cladophialophora chaetospira]